MSNKPAGGFTLVEVLVAITILATLIGGVVLSLNPFEQISKSQNAQRRADLNEVKTALDLYYEDNKCYPPDPSSGLSNAGIPFGNEWRVNNTVYMKEAPQDPRCDGGSGPCYRYRTVPGNNCPQWYVLFAELTAGSENENACPLSTLSACVPEGYEDKNWACVMGGAIDCGAIASSNISGLGEETISPTLTPTPLPSATPTPTPTPPDGSVTYSLGNDGSDNIDIYEATIMPLYAEPDEGQGIRVLADTLQGEITNMSVILYSDNEVREFPSLTLVTGTANNGTWQGAWTVEDTYNSNYGYDIIATDSLGGTAKAIIRVRN